ARMATSQTASTAAMTTMVSGKSTSTRPCFSTMTCLALPSCNTSFARSAIRLVLLIGYLLISAGSHQQLSRTAAQLSLSSKPGPVSAADHDFRGLDHGKNRVARLEVQAFGALSGDRSDQLRFALQFHHDFSHDSAEVHFFDASF